MGRASKEVDDPELLSATIEGVDVYVTSKEADGKTLEELGKLPGARGVYLRAHQAGRHRDADSHPRRHEALSRRRRHAGGANAGHVGRRQSARRPRSRQPTSPTSPSSALAITLGALIGAIVMKIGGVPITLSTAGGALIFGIVFGWYRATRPTFGRIPSATLWFMNYVGLNMFIAVIGLTAGPKFVTGLQQLGFGLFLWGIVATSVPLILAMSSRSTSSGSIRAIILGACAGARTTTAALGMICDAAQSQVPGLGYTVTYAVGNTLLTIWGMFIVMS